MHAVQVDSSLAMQNLKPTIDNIKRLYGDDKKRVQRETSALYAKAKVNPLAGALLLHSWLPDCKAPQPARVCPSSGSTLPPIVTDDVT